VVSLNTYRAWMKERRRTARAKNRCTSCFKNRTFSKAHCSRCLLRAKSYWEKSRSLARRAGLCPRCRRPTRNSYYCHRCNEIQADDKVVRTLCRLLAGQCVVCGRKSVAGGTRCQRCRRQHRAYNRKRESAIRERLLDLYGGCCNCCRIRIRQFLTLDHLLNDGRLERKKIRTSQVLYKRILDGRAPKERYQLLCYNCNLAKAHYGSCPHQVMFTPSAVQFA
jgi:hypothetical protein